ncbi:hypothetical protein [Streptomyces cyaneus]|uniref:hypothetical protein n=1 Tax=Streptomyces cyaneus TaxID=1904 RepID=UPI000FF8B498|nr:hypothetical protein [Streptomyces cyaneus]
MRQHEAPTILRRPAGDLKVEAPVHRLSRRRLAVAAAVVFATVVAVLVALLVPQRTGTPTAPSWSGEGVPCRSEPLTHVHNPTRLTVVANCATVSGVVRKVQYRPNDGNVHLTVAVDEKFQRYLRSANQGLLNVEVIPPDARYVIIPSVGKHATFFGAWVLDRNERRAAELHPAWRIVPDGIPVAQATPTPTTGSGKLSVAVDMPTAVAIGEQFRVVVRAQRSAAAKTAASEVRVFAEITNAAGKGVRWKAATTNTLGTASMDFIALHAPGTFVVHFYASKDGQSVVVAKPLTVTRR